MKHSHPKGFMAIVAIGVFALLIIFGLIVQLTVVDTYSSVKDTNNYYAARDIADSTMEFLQAELNKHDIGYSTGAVVCNYKDGKLTTTTSASNNLTSTLCTQSDISGTNDVTVKILIKGRAEESENLKTTKCKSGLTDFSNSCYVVPFQGTGDAGKKCNIASVTSNLDPADNSCNWNRLTFGGSTTDRVAIPLYYEGANGLVNPYKDKSATQLLFRLRTPCLPCVYDEDKVVTDVNRFCEKAADTTICTDEDRYVLDVLTDDKVVVQWQLSGKCDDGAGGEKDCSVLPIPGDKDSGVYESRINDSKDKWAYKIIDNKTQGNDISVHPVVKVSFLQGPLQAPPKLPLMTQPILNIFLSNSLISNEKKNVPYLEYQLLTNKPMGSPKVKLEAEVTVNGNTFKKTLYKEIKKDLVDFAIQN